MAFWLRAGLVIGAIYYLSPLRPGEAPPRTAQPPATQAVAPPASISPASASLASTNAVPQALAGIAGPVLAALPESLRARMVETAAAEAGRTLGTGLRAAAAEAVRPSSRDTLTTQDRQPAWRGVAEREAP